MASIAWFGSIGIAAALAASGCSSPPPPKASETPAATQEATAKPAGAEEIAKEPVETGKACAKAEAQCGGGVCSVQVNNGCDAAITCDFLIVTVCQAETDLVQAKAKRRETFASKAKESISIKADCAAQRIVTTKVDTLSCK